MSRLLQQLLSSDFLPHGTCYLWNPRLLWLHVISDALITLSYYCIPLILIYLVRRRQDLPFHWVFWMFGVFILGCGTTHLMEVWTIWHPTYFISGLVKAVTALVSVATAVALIPTIPKVLALVSPEQVQAANLKLKREADTRIERERQLLRLTQQLEQRIKERTGELESINQSLENEIAASVLTQAALRASEERIRLIIEAALDAVITMNSNGVITGWNPQAAAIFGHTRETVIGKSVAETIIPERFREVHVRGLQRYLNGGEATVLNRRIEISALHADGHEFPIEVSITPIRTGNNVTFSAFVRDITARRQGEESLSKSQAQLNGIIQSAMDAILTIDEQQTIILFNRAAETMFKCAAGDALGQSVERFIPERHRESHAQHIRHFGETGVTNRAMGQMNPLCAVRADGTEFPIEASISQIEQDGQKLFTVIIRDITERRLATEALAKQASELSRSQQGLEAQTRMLQSVLDSMAEGLVAADKEGKFLIWNRAAEKIVGYGPADLPTQQWSEHYGNFLPDGVTPFPTDKLPMVRALRGEACRDQIFLRNPKVPQGIWIEASASPLRDKEDSVSGGVVAFRDISQRKADEQQIRKLNEELEGRVQERTKELEASNKELEAFTYSVSHDLRAPLRHIAGFSKMLAEECGEDLKPESRHYLERIQDGTRRMGTLVDDLLNLARIGRHEVRVQVTGIDSIVRDVISELRPDAEGRNVEWKIGDLPFVEGDPALLKIVFHNLLSNALKYTRPRSPAIIEVGREELDGQPVVFVRDNGVGFNMKYADKLFGVFQRLHRAEDFEGTGVGLATVQRVVHKHGGRIWAHAELDKGATFYFSLAGTTETMAGSKTAGGAQ